MTRGRGDGAGAGGGGGDGDSAPARFRPPTRRTFVAMLGAAVTAYALRDQLTGRPVIRDPHTGRPIWIGHV